jgi:hypothetical protein
MALQRALSKRGHRGGDSRCVVGERISPRDSLQTQLYSPSMAFLFSPAKQPLDGVSLAFVVGTKNEQRANKAPSLQSHRGAGAELLRSKGRLARRGVGERISPSMALQRGGSLQSHRAPRDSLQAQLPNFAGGARNSKRPKGLVGLFSKPRPTRGWSEALPLLEERGGE